MTDIDKWLDNLRATQSSIKAARHAIQEIAEWVDRNVVASDVIPRQFPPELNGLFRVLDESLSQASETAMSIEDTLTQTLFDSLGGRPLSREQFHLVNALGLLYCTNKSAGLSEYDDYEVFQYFCYEDEERSGYIDAALEPIPQPVTDGDRKTRRVRVGPKFAPEDIIWERLKPKQRAFFERYLPEVAGRFKREI